MWKQVIIKNFPSAITFLEILKLCWRDKTLRPRKVKLTRTGNYLFATPYENRGLALLRNRGLGQPGIKRYWRLALDIFSPRVALDIGANYGEVMLDARYSLDTDLVLGIEANSALIPYLKRSIDHHPDSERIEILHALASDTSEKETTFYVDKSSSGRSTAVKENFVQDVKTIKIPSLRVDDLILSRIAFRLNDCLLFKIDVEGFEPFVINGMKKLWTKVDRIVGCIEFNAVSLERNGINISTYLNSLNKQFFILLLIKDKVKDVESLSVDTLKQYFTNKHIEGDILLFSNEKLKEEFLLRY